VIRARLAVQATDDIAPFGVVSWRGPHEIGRLSALHVAGLHDDHPRAFRAGVKPEAVGWSNALLNDLEEDKAARSVVFGLLAEMSGFYAPSLGGN
jgi:hypothetical protein